MTKLFEL